MCLIYIYIYICVCVCVCVCVLLLNEDLRFYSNEYPRFGRISSRIFLLSVLLYEFL